MIYIIYMWQLRVENEHYSAEVKIAFSTNIIALSLPLCGVQVLALLRKQTMRYRSPNTTPSAIALCCNFCHVSKNANARSTRRLVLATRRLWLICLRYLNEK